MILKSRKSALCFHSSIKLKAVVYQNSFFNRFRSTWQGTQFRFALERLLHAACASLMNRKRWFNAKPKFVNTSLWASLCLYLFCNVTTHCYLTSARSISWNEAGNNRGCPKTRFRPRCILPRSTNCTLCNNVLHFEFCACIFFGCTVRDFWRHLSGLARLRECVASLSSDVKRKYANKLRQARGAKREVFSQC